MFIKGGQRLGYNSVYVTGGVCGGWIRVCAHWSAALSSWATSRWFWLSPCSTYRGLGQRLQPMALQHNPCAAWVHASLPLKIRCSSFCPYFNSDEKAVMQSDGSNVSVRLVVLCGWENVCYFILYVFLFFFISIQILKQNVKMITWRSASVSMAPLPVCSILQVSL